MTLAVVLTAHGFKGAPNGLLYNLTEQTRQPDTVYLALSDVPEFAVPRTATYRTRAFIYPNLGRFGYPKRRLILPQVKEDFVCFMCHDDSYDPTFLAQVEKAIEAGADVVYCGWSKVPDCEFAHFRSTLGNFVARTSLVQKVGLPHTPKGKYDEDAISDAALIEGLQALSPRVTRLNDLLYFHNVPRFQQKVSEWGKMIHPTQTYGTR